MRLISLAALLVLLFSSFALAGEPVGVVRTANGEAFVVRNGVDFGVSPGFKIEQGDLLRTGADGSMGIYFRDDATMSLGPNSLADVKNFVFEPAKEEYSLLVKVVRGTLCYISGIIGKLSPDSAKFETPVASLSIRGTKFLVKVD